MSELVAKLRELAEKATPGPWLVDDERETVYVQLSQKGICRTANSSYRLSELPRQELENNAAFIAAARNALPTLLELLDSQRQKIERLEKILRRLPLDSFGDDMGKCDAADFVDHAGEFFEAMLAARNELQPEAPKPVKESR